MLVTLTTWASREIENPPPHRTLCQWAKNGQISGAVKVGRIWMCDESSVYISSNVQTDGVSGRVLDILNRRVA